MSFWQLFEFGDWKICEIEIRSDSGEKNVNQTRVGLVVLSLWTSSVDEGRLMPPWARDGCVLLE